MRPSPSAALWGCLLSIAGIGRRTTASGTVKIKDVFIPADYVPPAYADSRSYPETVVPPHCYFVLGDHRSSSNDSRVWGTVERSYIYGKAVFVYWPLEKMGRLR